MEYGLVVVWLGLFLALGAVALPAGSAVFATLPDRGAGLAIPFAFAWLAFVGYWIGQATFGPETAIAALVSLVVGSGLAMRHGVEVHWRRYRDAALVFTLAFLLLVGIRAYDPAVHPVGGEKFLDFGLLASLLRAGSLPPEDMWFANEPVQYYYGGHMLAAMFAQLTDTAAKYAYNLALAGYYAAFVTAAWGIGGAMGAGRGGSYGRGGAVAAFFVALASNLSPPIRLLVWALPTTLGDRLADLASIDVKWLATGPSNFHYWFASRVMERGASDGTFITEFPFFAFLNGDLHGHMMSPVFLLLGVGLAYAYWRTTEEDAFRRAGLVFLAIPPVVGLLLVVNTWSAPALVGITWLTLLFAPTPPWRLLPTRVAARFDRVADAGILRQESARIAVATVLAGVIAALGAISVAPFLLGPATGRSIGLFPESPSRLAGLLVVHGGFLAITVPYLGRGHSRDRLAIVGLLAIAAIGVTSALGVPAVGLFGPVLLGAWYLLRTGGDVNFETVLVVGVMGLLVLVEFVYVIEQAGPGRLNTVFKVYAQVWALWTVAVGAMTAGLPPIKPSVRRFGRTLRGRTGRDTETAGSVATVLLVVLLVSTSIYAGFAIATTVGGQSGSPTLDAHAYIEADHPHEAAAIEWVGDRSGQPTMVSAPGESIYEWVNAPSSMTGVPTVAGWSHEIGYRGGEAYRSRVRDVDAIFETSDQRTRANLLDRYDVTYMYVGPVERERYERHSYGDEPGISVAYEDEWVTIYRVDESELTA
ncbi:DUF2298 domain-containing protein [Halanaeroarchaeum sulfurireducens]|uniref:Chlor_Arch_YYY domain-containing protein n=1 Tax=Halanaeroarchaeum sulfurireducens TaxID=1604004 RepID=A0A0F7PCE1_9EURY|nr:DUF2298 domain-containing protein [Halanaeroarchaeum sulfurireducens]AKH97304.1 hypothetical protein HLASF_0809 [Halanaeroarchaeum sulfurireducens]